MEEAIITTSWDDGNPLDMKLAELLKKYDVPATFYVPINYVKRGGISPDQIREIGAQFDVGGHSYNHVALTRIPVDEAAREVVDGKSSLEEILGRQVKSFCYPKGLHNKRIKGIVRDAGFSGARTVKLFTRRTNDPYELGTTITARDYRVTFYARHLRHSLRLGDAGMPLYMLKNGLIFRCWERMAVETLEYVLKNGGVWHLWGHSWEIEENNAWERLRSVLIEIKEMAAEARKLDNSELVEMYTGGV